MQTSKLFRRLTLASLTAIASGALVIATAGAGSVSAPEPADLTATLAGSTGATGAAVYHFSQAAVPNGVVLWPASWTPGGKAPAGSPCSTYGMAPGDRTTKTIQVTGTLRRCV